MSSVWDDSDVDLEEVTPVPENEPQGSGSFGLPPEKLESLAVEVIEKVVREIVPELAERLIQEKLEQLLKESEK
jgi:hypothetical protein